MSAGRTNDTLGLGALDADTAFMSEAIALARRAEGLTSPNPLVGCVLVRDGVVVGRGWHEGPGLPHAEVAAISDAGEAARGATAYVTLEPCNHTGRTGPCTEALIAAGVSEIIYAVSDPNPLAAGGATRLREAGLTVRAGVCEAQARAMNVAWLHAMAFRRPYVIAKAAMSLDGRIATRTGVSKWLTGPEARRKGHGLRARSDAILVGAGTICADDPALTARLDGETRAPLRVVLDSTGRSPLGAKAFERSDDPSRPSALLATTRNCPTDRRAAFEAAGVDVAVLETDDSSRPDLDDLMAELHRREVRTLMVEGGGTVLGSFLDRDLIDEIHLFYAPLIIGGGKSAFDGDGVDRVTDAGGFDFEPPEQVGADFLVRGRRRRAR
ncbi:MAG: bifunctional diaminohydroxyphosphoribosylaminopyrimidine deaminase/5-amino-6-(5-phosphoribosylamino)uracil reductase RibD [Pseudomonadota bacterium]